MNATAGEVTVHSPDNHLTPPEGATPFAEWTASVDGPQRELGPADHPERRHYGSYLRDLFHRLWAAPPAGVRVYPILGEATRLEPSIGGLWLTVDHGRRRLRVDKVVLATGHAELAPTAEEQALREHAQRHPGLRYVGQGVPPDMPLDQVRPGQSVAVRGLGLTFYDVLRSLTLGRGGRFRRSAGGRLRYLPSGREPVLLAGSRGGLPFLGRARVPQPPQTAPSPVALTEKRVVALRAAARAARGSPQLDFAREVEPLIGFEMDYAYCTTAARQRGGQRAAERFGTAFRRLIEDGDAGDREAVLAAHGLGDLPAIRLQPLARPFDGNTFAGPAGFRRQLLEVLRADLAECRKGTAASPLKAALETLRTLRPALPSIVDFGGLLPASHRDFLTRFVPMSFVLSAGPPAEHVEQAVALLEAGVLDVVGPAARFSADPAGGCFTLESPAVPRSRRSAQVLVEARVPTTDVTRDASPLVRRILADGLIAEYVVTGPPGTDPFHTGGPAITPAPSRVLDAAGRPNPDVYAIGVATEGARWFTQVGTGRPGRDSPFCRDADAIALDVLAAAGSRATR